VSSRATTSVLLLASVALVVAGGPAVASRTPTVAPTAPDAPAVELVSDDELAAALHEPRAAVGGAGGSATQHEAFEIAKAAAEKLGGVHGVETGARPRDESQRSATRTALAPPQRGSYVTASRGGAAGARSVPVEPADPHWYSIASQTKDWSGTDLPTRYGDYSNFGYNKIVVVHHISDTAVVEAPYHGYVDAKNGTNWTYYGAVLINGHPKTALTSVASVSKTSRYGATPDSRHVGTITAFCNNASTQACPDYIP
jgi:hypothetical protein